MERGRRKSLTRYRGQDGFLAADPLWLRNDNGHFYYREVEGDFTAEVAFSADYRAQYDQAGLMLRYGPTQWIKGGVEFAHGHAVVSAVYTQELSDWRSGLKFRLLEDSFCVSRA